MKKMKKTLALALALVCLNLYSQTKDDALRDAKITSKATLNMDFETVLKHTLPAIIDMMGGEEAGLSMLKSTFDGMKAQGFVFEKADIKGVSEIVEEQGQYRCIIEGFNQMTMSGQRIKSKSYLLGIYNDKENHWWFVEAKLVKNQAMIDQILPEFKTSLDIPEDDMQTEPIED